MSGIIKVNYVVDRWASLKHRLTRWWGQTVNWVELTRH